MKKWWQTEQPPIRQQLGRQRLLPDSVNGSVALPGGKVRAIVVLLPLISGRSAHTGPQPVQPTEKPNGSHSSFGLWNERDGYLGHLPDHSIASSKAPTVSSA